MKKFVLFTMIIIMCFTLIGCNTEDYITAQPKVLENLSTYALLEEFLDKNPVRTCGVEVEKEGEFNGADATAFYLQTYFRNLGLTGEITQFNYENIYRNDRTEQAYNVVFKYDTPSEKQIIIGANYDNASLIKVEGNYIVGEGAYNNATGIAVLMQLAKLVKDSKIDYDVVFVAFGAKEYGFKGSNAYVKSMTEKDIANTLLMINLDSVVGGDYLYMYSDEVKTLHNNYFYEVAKTNQLNAKKVPIFKKQNVLAGEENFKIPYSHIGLQSDSVNFMKKDISVVNFLSLNWENRIANVEMKGQPNVAYTQKDTLSDMIERFGGGDIGKQKIALALDNVVTIVYDAISKENFIASMQQSKDNYKPYSFWTSSKNVTIFTWCIKGFFMLGVVLLLVILKKKFPPKKLPIINIDTKAGNPFEELEKMLNLNNSGNNGDNNTKNGVNNGGDNSNDGTDISDIFGI
ncbi:MAG: M28 family peptidase [Clostridia bacterium]